MKNAGFKILYLVTAIVIIVELVFAVRSSLFVDIADLPTGTLIEECSKESPSGDKSLNIYLVKNNLGAAIRGEVSSDKGTHNIFWQTGIDTVEVVWIDDETVLINEIPLDVNDTTGYDCRRGYSLFDEGSLEQNFTDFRGENEEE